MYTRNSERIRALLGAQVIFNNNNSTLNCQVRNISAGGARLAVSQTVSLPEEFDLVISQKGRTYRCKLRWRTGEAVGVEFLSSRSLGNSSKGKEEAATDDDRMRELETENDELRRQVRELTERLAAIEGRQSGTAAA